MQQYRLTKYDPANRNSTGAYTRDEWTSISDVGSYIGGKLVTLEGYKATEAAYIRVVCSLARAASIGPFEVSAIERRPVSVSNGDCIPVEGLPRIIRSLLREESGAGLLIRLGILSM